MHTLALKAGGGLASHPWGMRKQFRRPWVGEVGPVHLLMWVMPRLKTNHKQLPIPVRGFWLCMQSTWAEILGV